MNLRIGISPCPNDTYIMEAIYEKQIDIEPFSFEFIFEDVETLNRLAQKGEIDVLKMSYANFLQVTNNYCMLRSGSALGRGVGPLLITTKKNLHVDLSSLHIAIPGINTTANFLLQFAFPEITNKTVMVFSAIENAILEHKVDAGVIIHENRFTYANKGLQKIADLGSIWEEKKKLPIPLGGIAILRKHSFTYQHQLNQLIYTSIAHANARTEKISSFIRHHAQELSDDVMKQHIQLYVNEFSMDIGSEGIQAVREMNRIITNHSEPSLFYKS
jgi:1,4-dihydroxy-6-naphthoate synthase